MKLEEVRIKGKTLHTATLEEVAEAERVLKTTLPAGYAEYVTHLGEGTLSNWVRVYPPWRVVGELKSWRERIKSHWFWEAGERKLSFARAQKCIIIADTIGGDELIFYPAKPDRLFVLPREDEDIHVLDGSFWDSLDWLCTSGKLTKPLRTFQFKPAPESSRREITPEPAPRPKRTAKTTGAPSRSPEETLTAFWDAYTALGEECELRMNERTEEKTRRGEETHELTDEDVAEDRRFLERDRELWAAFVIPPYEEGVYPSATQYAPEWRERIDRVEVKGSRVCVYARRPNFPSGTMDRARKYRWVLQLVDGEWRIKERQKEAMKIDTYRPCSVKIG